MSLPTSIAVEMEHFPDKWKALLKERAPEPQGFLTVRRRHKELGRSEVVLPWDKNLVVNTGRDVICDLIQGAIGTTPWPDLATAETLRVTRALIGDGGHDTGDPSTPLNVLPTDIDLGNFLYELAIEAYGRPSQTSASFQFTIPDSGPNDPFSEAGLAIEADGDPWDPSSSGTTHKLFSRKCFGFITKVPGWEYVFTWIIIF